MSPSAPHLQAPLSSTPHPGASVVSPSVWAAQTAVSIASACAAVYSRQLISDPFAKSSNNKYLKASECSLSAWSPDWGNSGSGGLFRTEQGEYKTVVMVPSKIVAEALEEKAYLLLFQAALRDVPVVSEVWQILLGSVAERAVKDAQKDASHITQMMSRLGSTTAIRDPFGLPTNSFYENDHAVSADDLVSTTLDGFLDQMLRPLAEALQRVHDRWTRPEMIQRLDGLGDLSAPVVSISVAVDAARDVPDTPAPASVPQLAVGRRSTP